MSLTQVRWSWRTRIQWFPVQLSWRTRLWWSWRTRFPVVLEDPTPLVLSLVVLEDPEVATEPPNFTAAAIIKKAVFAFGLWAILHTWEHSESTPEPAPAREHSESTPEPAPTQEHSVSAYESTPVQEPSESTPEPAPVWESSEPTHEPAPVRKPSEVMSSLRSPLKSTN